MGRRGKAAKKECHEKRPEITSVSFVCDEGIMVPVCWSLGPVYCGYCRNHRTTSWQAVTRHLKDFHRDAAIEFKEDINENAYNRYEVSEEHGDEFRLEDKVTLKIGRRGTIDGDQKNEVSENAEENLKEYADDSEKKKAEYANERYKKKESHEKRPKVTSVSFVCEKGLMVPVCWTFGPAYCGYCKNHKLASFQAVYKHLRDHHKDDVTKFRSEMMINGYHRYKLGLKSGDEFRLEDKVVLDFGERPTIDETIGLKRPNDGNSDTRISKRRNNRFLPTKSNNQHLANVDNSDSN